MPIRIKTSGRNHQVAIRRGSILYSIIDHFVRGSNGYRNFVQNFFPGSPIHLIFPAGIFGKMVPFGNTKVLIFFRKISVQFVPVLKLSYFLVELKSASGHMYYFDSYLINKKRGHIFIPLRIPCSQSWIHLTTEKIYTGDKARH